MLRGKRHDVTDASGAIVLAGGRASRMGGIHKPALDVGGQPIVARVVHAVGAHLGSLRTTVVVGDGDGVPAGAWIVREDPAGAGPVVAVDRGLTEMRGSERVFLLAGDMPFLSSSLLARLDEALCAAQGSSSDPGPEVAVLIDPLGRDQYLCSLWRADALRARIGTALGPGADAAGERRAEGPARGDPSMRSVFRGARIIRVIAHDLEAFDVDRPADLEHARNVSG